MGAYTRGYDDAESSADGDIRAKEHKITQLKAENKELREKGHFYMLQFRDISTPCKECSGYGVKSYVNTSTWSHGIGGQAITSGICDGCWGSGDADNKWVDLRTLRGNKQLQAENKTLEVSLRRYGCHEEGCTANGPGGCNCGLMKLLMELSKEQGNEAV